LCPCEQIPTYGFIGILRFGVSDDSTEFTLIKLKPGFEDKKKNAPPNSEKSKGIK
jgi:hypothetical protein